MSTITLQSGTIIPVPGGEISLMYVLHGPSDGSAPARADIIVDWEGGGESRLTVVDQSWCDLGDGHQRWVRISLREDDGPDVVTLTLAAAHA